MTQHETALRDAAEIIQEHADSGADTWAADAAREILGPGGSALVHVDAMIAADEALYHRTLDSPAVEHWRAIVQLAMASTKEVADG